MALFRNKKTAHFIINDHSIRYMELKSQEPPYPLKWGERFLTEGIVRNGRMMDRDSLKLILEECVDVWKLKNRKIQIIVPDSFVIIRKVSVPPDIKDDELEGYLYLEMGVSIHLPFEEPVFDTIVLTEDMEKKEVILIAAQEDHVNEYVDLFTEVKLNPVAADLSSLAFYRLYNQLQGDKKTSENALMIQMDLENVNITIFEKQNPIFAHYLPLYFHMADWKIKRNRLQISEWVFQGNKDELMMEYDDLFREVNRLMDFYRYSIHQGREEITTIILNGDHPLLPLIQKELSNRYELPVIVPEVDPLLPGFRRSLPRAFHLVFGLALKEVK